MHIPRSIPKHWPLMLHPTEVTYCLYMPVSVPDNPNIVLNYIERPDLAFVLPLIHKIRELEPDVFKERYVYLTVKRMYVSPSVTPNRPGWHADGFGTDDINYIWYDCVPTLLSAGKFDVDEGDAKSLIQFEEQANQQDTYTIDPNTLIRLTPAHVHRVQIPTEQVMRTFVKVSLSKQQYNLAGNSTNPQIKVWRTYPREVVRNSPISSNKDFHNPVDPHLQ